MVLNAQKIYVITTGQRMTFLQLIKNVVLSWVTVQEGLPENMPPDETVTRLSKHAVTKPRCKRPATSEKVSSMSCER